MRLPGLEGYRPLYPIVGCMGAPEGGGDWIRTYRDYLAVRKCRQNYLDRWNKDGHKETGSWRKGVTRLTK